LPPSPPPKRMTAWRFLIVAVSMLLASLATPARAQPLQFEGVEFSKNFFASTPTASEVLEGLEQWGYYDQAFAWSKDKLGADPSVTKRIETKKAALLALTSSYMLPADTFPRPDLAQGDLSGDGKVERVILYCRKTGQSIVRPSVFGFPLPVFLRVVSGTMTIVDMPIKSECSPNMTMFPIQGAAFIQLQVFGRGNCNEYYRWHSGALARVIAVNALGQDVPIMACTGGGGDWWIESSFQDGGKRFVEVRGKIDQAGARKEETREIFVWDGEKYLLKPN